MLEYMPRILYPLHVPKETDKWSSLCCRILKGLTKFTPLPDFSWHFVGQMKSTAAEEKANFSVIGIKKGLWRFFTSQTENFIA